MFPFGHRLLLNERCVPNYSTLLPPRLQLEQNILCGFFVVISGILQGGHRALREGRTNALKAKLLKDRAGTPLDELGGRFQRTIWFM
jgi:hypothetical protein